MNNSRLIRLGMVKLMLLFLLQNLFLTHKNMNISSAQKNMRECELDKYESYSCSRLLYRLAEQFKFASNWYMFWHVLAFVKFARYKHKVDKFISKNVTSLSLGIHQSRKIKLFLLLGSGTDWQTDLCLKVHRSLFISLCNTHAVHVESICPTQEMKAFCLSCS